MASETGGDGKGGTRRVLVPKFLVKTYELMEDKSKSVYIRYITVLT